MHKANKSDKQRILYAPSWRSYLVGENVNGDWKALNSFLQDIIWKPKLFWKVMCYTKCWRNRNVDFMTKIDEEEIAKTSDEIINKIEKFFMTGKGMLYDVHFWKNDICNSTELIYQKCYLFRQEHDLSPELP